jgi:hypothetical protein
VSLSLANDAASLPVAFRLYLPKDWAEDNEPRCKAGIPEEIGFKTKPAIALEQIRWACERDLPGDLVVIDAGYGNTSQLRAGITELGKLYVAGIQSQTLVSKPSPRRGRAAKKRRRDASNALSVKALAVRAKAWHTIEWREGTNEGRGANLNLANLSGANLGYAHLSGADLGDADLLGANLNRADLHGADLHGADLRGANLNLANLNLANLSGANLANAKLYETAFVNSNLTGVVGLETCIHYGASAIDWRTLQKSGLLPIPFLRGVGLPEPLIEYLPALLKQAIRYYSCFISYSTKDQDFADRIYADL